ncbi:MAG: phosphatidate cytidylyltransferase [Ruminiclostridium sp.]|nr:phosphatidate cytidylyltransferase [Ruminiclostridium sp.]
MKTRIISAAVALVLLAVIMLSGRETLSLAIFVLTLIGIHEFNGAMENGGYKPIKPIGYLSCLPLLYLSFKDIINPNGPAFAFISSKGLPLAMFLVILAVFCTLIFKYDKYKITDIAVTIMGLFYVVFLFSFIILVRNMGERGDLYIWLVFVGAWAPDTAAYFTGVAFGKTKILPVISPKKTLEGSMGGVAGGMAIMPAVGLYLNVQGIQPGGISFYHYIILGLLCGIISQVGDWAASAIKRHAGIKDYGRLMPGHGGVLDRFDSTLFVAPVVYFYLSIFLSVA